VNTTEDLTGDDRGAGVGPGPGCEPGDSGDSGSGDSGSGDSGASGDAAGALGARQPGPSLGPALLIVAIAVVILVLGAVVALVGSASAHAPVGQLGSAVPGVSVRAVPASAMLGHIEQAGEPPADIVKELNVPAGAKLVSDASASAGVSQFDSSVTFSVADPPTLVRSFYKADLPLGHWSMQFDGSASGNLELIGQKNGSDGYQWRVAIVVQTVNPSISPALAGSDSTSTSKVVMSLYQVVDAS
jgi:hypothetical protein